MWRYDSRGIFTYKSELGRVLGNEKQNVEPLPFELFTQMFPPCLLTISAAIAD